MKTIVTLVCALTLTTIDATAQTPVGFNIALQDPAFSAVPSSSYGAAAQQPGDWNLVTGLLVNDLISAPLTDVNGNPSAATLEIGVDVNSSYIRWMTIDLAATTGDDETFLDHGLWTTSAQCGKIAFSIHDLPAGSYRLFSYAVGLEVYTTTCFDLAASTDGLKHTANSVGFVQGYVQDLTHTVHRFDVLAGETVQVRWGVFGAFAYDGRLNGLQIVPDGSSQAVSFCDSQINSTGAMASMVFSGTPSIAANDLTLGVRDLPQNQFGYFVVSQTAGSGITPPGSQGTLCIGGGVGRHNRSGEVLFSGTTGAVLMPLNLANVPQPQGPIAIAVGETWNWQYWFRDQNPTSTSNFSDGNRVTFTQ